MSTHNISAPCMAQDYANNLVFELEKAFWDERGKGARFRVTTVGRQFFTEQCLPALQSSEIEEMIGTIEAKLREHGIVRQVSVERDGRLLRVQVAGCVHRPVEDKLVAAGAKPFTCIPANLIVLAIEEKLDRPVELAEIKLEDGACKVLLALFDARPFLG
jgi:hypothetical protein